MGKVVLFLAWSFSILLVVFLMALLFYFFTGQTNSLSQGLAIRGNSKSLIPSLETLIEEPNELDQETIISISVPESQAERAIRQGTGRAEKAVDDCLDSIKGDQLTVAQFEKQARGCLERD
jgi:predicted PurR-regulated permease PerM